MDLINQSTSISSTFIFVQCPQISALPSRQILFKQIISMNNKFWNAPAWSLGNKFEGKSKGKDVGVTIPGPGSYDLGGAGKKVGGKIGSSTRGKNEEDFQPGPGKYDISSKNSGPKISMGSKFIHNGMGPNSFTPGPGNYNTFTVTRPNSGVTIGAKYGDSKNQETEPGPGSYNLGSSKRTGAKIGTAQRKNFESKEENPGPGEYTYEKRPYSAGPKYGFGRAGKGNGYSESVPGPGQYDPTTSFLRAGEANGCTIGEKFKKTQHDLERAPGPGYYDTEIKRVGSGAKIGRAKRGNIGNEYTPGPGAYDNNYRSAHGAKIGTRRRGDFGRTETPGPGAYDSSKSMKGGITISGHKGKSKFDDVPGPGSYNSTDYNRCRPSSANIGRSLRSEADRAQTPGPGQYYHRDSSNYKFAYTKELRSKNLKKQDPGPGQYDIPSTVPSAPHYLIDPNVYKSYGSRS